MESLLTIEAHDCKGLEVGFEDSSSGAGKVLGFGSDTSSKSTGMGPVPDSRGQGTQTTLSSTVDPVCRAGTPKTQTEEGECEIDCEEDERKRVGGEDGAATGSEGEEGRESFGGEQGHGWRSGAIGAGGKDERRDRANAQILKTSMAAKTLERRKSISLYKWNKDFPSGQYVDLDGLVVGLLRF